MSEFIISHVRFQNFTCRISDFQMSAFKISHVRFRNLTFQILEFLMSDFRILYPRFQNFRNSETHLDFKISHVIFRNFRYQLLNNAANFDKKKSAKIQKITFFPGTLTCTKDDSLKSSSSSYDLFVPAEFCRSMIECPPS